MSIVQTYLFPNPTRKDSHEDAASCCLIDCSTSSGVDIPSQMLEGKVMLTILSMDLLLDKVLLGIAI